MKYEVQTDMYTQDDKWIYYRHVFLEDADKHADRLQSSGHHQSNPSTPPDLDVQAERREYAVCVVKAVLKDRTGRTVRPSVLSTASPLMEELFEAELKEMKV
jgi:hypothetical protein